MKHLNRSLSFLLPGIAALLSPGATHARPLFSPLLKAVPLAALLTSQENTLLASVTPKVPRPALPLLTRTAGQPLWSLGGQSLGGQSLGGASLWNRALDPTLRLTDWRHVFDIAALGSFDIPLRDDPAERTNILLSAQAVDNVTVAPGEEFSFNAQVGERTPERGYLDGLMFDNGHVVRGTGGGICLVATGLYNAALQAGLEITERHPHSGIVSYAPPGCDAGIVYGTEDMKFRNTTVRPIVIRTEAADDHVTIQLFGQTPPLGRNVIVRQTSLEKIPFSVITTPDPTLLPGQSVVEQKPRSGYDVVVERFWLQGKRVVRREVVADEHRAPRPEIIRIALPPVVPTSVSPTSLLGVPGPDNTEPGSLLPLNLPTSGVLPVAPPTVSDPVGKTAKVKSQRLKDTQPGD